MLVRISGKNPELQSRSFWGVWGDAKLFCHRRRHRHHQHLFNVTVVHKNFININYYYVPFEIERIVHTMK